VSSPAAGKKRRSVPAWAVVAVALMASPAAASPRASPEDTLRAVQRSLAVGDWLAVRSRLEQAAAAHPEDCTVRAWLAWVEIESGRWDPAEALLAAPGARCSPKTGVVGRS
jgi:Tetratricopeptide repeat